MLILIYKTNAWRVVRLIPNLYSEIFHCWPRAGGGGGGGGHPLPNEGAFAIFTLKWSDLVHA